MTNFFSLFLFLILLVPVEGFAFEDVRTPVVVGVQEEGWALHGDAVESLYDGLSRVLSDHSVVLKTLDVDDLSSRDGASDVDFLISSASVFAALQHYAGFSAVASLTDVLSSAPEHDSAAVVLVRRSGVYKTLGDLSEARIGLCSAADSEVEFYLSEEFRLRGIDVGKSLKFTRLHFNDMDSCLAHFASQAAAIDALALRSSRSIVKHKLEKFGLKALEPRLNDDLKLIHTTSTYPGWILSAGFKTSRDLQARVGAVARTTDCGESSKWTIPADVRALHSALQRSDSFYAGLTPKNIRDYIDEYKTLMVAVVVALAAAVLHMSRTSHLLRRRTRELTLANEQRIESERRFHLLEKQNIVGQISSIVAHEIRQPLAAVSNYAMALRRRSGNGSLDDDSLAYGLQRMVEESARANEIVGYVQKFVRNSEKSKEWLDLREQISAIAAAYASSTGEALVDVSGCASTRYLIDKMDLRLMTENLMKNALEASRATGAEAVEASCGIQPDGCVFIKIVDFGPKLSDEEFSRLSSPLNSSKMGGLGLGVSIVRLIAEGYGGHLEFIQMEPSGISAVVVLPRIDEKDRDRS